MSYDFAHAHNLLLQVTLDLGLLGLVTYLAILIATAAMAWQAARAYPQKRPFALGLLAGLIALHVYGLADALALGAKPGILFWYNLGLINALFLLPSQPQ